MTKHKRIGPSSLHRILQCTGSVYMQEKFPQQETSAAAAEGTLYHEVVEAVFNDYLFGGFPLNEAYKIHKDKCSDDEMKNHVLATCEEMKTQLEQIGAEKIKKLGLEEKFILSEKLGIGGTCDFAYIVELPTKERVLVIWDFKYGKHLVDADKNPQLAGYVCSANATKGWGPFDRAVAHIYQPRAEHPEGPLRRTKFSKEEIEQWSAKLLEVGQKVHTELERGAPTFSPGDHCKFCAGSGNCQAQLGQIQEAAELDFSPTTLAEEPKLPDPKTLTLEQKQALVVHCKALEEFLAAVKRSVLSELKKGAEYPELKLVRARTRRGWTGNADAVVKELEDRGMEKPYDIKLCALSAVTKALGKKAAEEVFAEHTEKPEGAVQVAPVTDKRVSITNEAREDFDENS